MQLALRPLSPDRLSMMGRLGQGCQLTYQIVHDHRISFPITARISGPTNPGPDYALYVPTADLALYNHTSVVYRYAIAM
jgi:hypothetical protein